MFLVRGKAGGTELTGTIYKRSENPPSFKGAPETNSTYVWICDEFYEVETGGSVQVVDGDEKRIAFEPPVPRGFETLDGAIQGAREHIRTQFARIGVPKDEVETEVVRHD
ncbi:hypothetical protein ACEU6E_02075 [Halorutilales archaeon Cl-col2-1]